MIKFKKGERVKILSKTCGPIQGLKNTLTKRYTKRDDCIPKYGIIKQIVEKNSDYGPHYTVTPDPYDSEIFYYKNMMFYEVDLDIVDNDWLQDDMFII